MKRKFLKGEKLEEACDSIIIKINANNCLVIWQMADQTPVEDVQYSRLPR